MAGGAVVLILAVAILQLDLAVSLHVTSAKPKVRVRLRTTNSICKESLTRSQECPGVGSYPMAGACDYFALCIEPDDDVESSLEFCPDGQIFVVNKCVLIPSSGDTCPQKDCPTKQFPVYLRTTTAPPPSTTSVHSTTITVTKRAPPMTTSRKPSLFSSLHPSVRNSAGSTGGSGEILHVIVGTIIVFVAVFVIKV